METKITQIAEVLQELLTTKADELGQASGFIKRQKKFSGSHFAQTLVFGWFEENRFAFGVLYLLNLFVKATININIAVCRNN